MILSASRWYTKGQIMNRKWALLNASETGPMGRGQTGKKKVYEVIVDGRTLTCSWGMAEKTQRQTSRRVFATEQAALSAAYEKVSAKQGRGYQIAYAV
jgi:predicted DNA-binding WGR domain protein